MDKQGLLEVGDVIQTDASWRMFQGDERHEVQVSNLAVRKKIPDDQLFGSKRIVVTATATLTGGGVSGSAERGFVAPGHYVRAQEIDENDQIIEGTKTVVISQQSSRNNIIANPTVVDNIELPAADFDMSDSITFFRLYLNSKKLRSNIIISNYTEPWNDK